VSEESAIHTDLGGTALEGSGFRLRPFKSDDREAIAMHLNDRKVWRNLTDRIPHPYTLSDADEWLERQAKSRRENRIHNFAIEVAGEACGSIGIEPFSDLARRGAEIGYWLGREHWGAGIATRALTQLTEHIFAVTDLVRLQATIIDWNPASCRVAEKAGYVCEGRLRLSISKDGTITDSLLYARIRNDE